ncbi:MAG: hypothetical protein HYX94_11775, partial [Chloroflexi bacterium]|nr:hypothetical protein [Chloroflexota bacterium]
YAISCLDKGVHLNGKRVKKAETNGGVVTTTVYPGNHYELKTYSISSDLPWWNPRWAQREVLTVTNQMGLVLTAGYTLKVYLSGSQASNIYGKSMASGNDLRVVYWNGKAWKELDRDLVSFSSSTIELRVKTQADIAASGQDANYDLYYGDPTAASPPAEGKKVYSYFNEFSVDRATASDTWARLSLAPPDYAGRTTMSRSTAVRYSLIGAAFS